MLQYVNYFYANWNPEDPEKKLTSKLGLSISFHQGNSILDDDGEKRKFYLLSSSEVVDIVLSPFGIRTTLTQNVTSYYN